jgi:hypothetical protein
MGLNIRSGGGVLYKQDDGLPGSVRNWILWLKEKIAFLRNILFHSIKLSETEGKVVPALKGSSKLSQGNLYTPPVLTSSKSPFYV